MDSKTRQICAEGAAIARAAGNDWVRLGILPLAVDDEPEWLTSLRISDDPLSDAAASLRSGAVSDADLAVVLVGGSDMELVRRAAGVEEDE